MSTVEVDVPPERAGSVAAGSPPPLASFLAVLVLVELFSGVLQAYFTPIYPMLADRFGVGVGTLSWSLTAFTLATAVTTPVFAKLGDVWGHRRVLRVEVGLVALGSVLVAIAPTFAVLIVGRALQGMFAAYLPLMFGLVRSRYSLDHTRRAVSYLTSVLIFGILGGTLAVGLLVRFTNGPTWALWLPAAGALAGFAGLVVVRGETVHRRPDVHVDWIGAVLLSLGLLVLLLGLTEGPTWGWASARVLGCLGGGIVVLAVWCAVELRVSQPLADLRFLFTPAFVPVYVIGFCIYFGSVGGQVVGSTFMAAPPGVLGYGLGLDTFHIAMWLPVALLLMFLGVLSTARLGRLIGFRTVMLLGAVAGAVGFGALVVWHGSLAIYLVLYGIGALGTGLVESSTRTLVVDGMREGEVSIGEGVYELSITVGGAVGSAALGAVMSAHESRLAAHATENGYALCWAVMGGVCVLAAVVAVGFSLATRRRGAAGRVAPVPVGG